MVLSLIVYLYIYRFVDVHYQLVPYLLTTGSEAYENGRSSLSPLAKHDSFIDKVIQSITLGVSLVGACILPRHLLCVERIPGEEDSGGA